VVRSAHVRTRNYHVKADRPPERCRGNDAPADRGATACARLNCSVSGT
jgi:hypothetical protein